MKIKPAKLVLFIILMFMLSIITFFTFNLVFTVVANHQAIDDVTLSGLPMILFMSILYIVLVAWYRFTFKKGVDTISLRSYSIALSILSLIGIGLSIYVGTAIYHSFVKDYVFRCYPLIMLIVFILLLAGSIYTLVYSVKKIRNEHLTKTYKHNVLYELRMLGLGVLLVYALERLGGVLLFPIYYSSVDSIYTFPYIIQMLVPTMVMVTYIIHEDFLHNRKVTLILSSVLVGYSLFSLIYMISMSKGTYPLMINSLSVVQQFERLVCYPIDAILLYGVSFIIPLLNGLNNAIMIVKEKKGN